MSNPFLCALAVLDACAQERMRALYRLLRDEGLTGSQTAGIPYHLTLAYYDASQEDSAWNRILAACRQQYAIPVRLSHVGLFGQKVPQSIVVDDPVLLDSIRIRKQEEALDLKYQDLTGKQDELAKLDLTISQKTADITEREKAQDDREKSFNEKLKAYDNRKANLVRISQDLTSMKPAAAVKIMNGYDDQLLIDILRTTQELADAAGATSLVSVWLSQLDPARTAEIQRKMTLKPPATE